MPRSIASPASKKRVKGPSATGADRSRNIMVYAQSAGWAKTEEADFVPDAPFDLPERMAPTIQSCAYART